jgi:hypothetical protein
MESLRRLAVYQGVTYPDYEIDFYTSNVYSKRFKDRVLTTHENRLGYTRMNLSNNGYLINARQHKLFAETFQDLLPKSPLVSHYDLQIGKDRHELKTATGFRVICNMVCPDHIDGDPSNNHHSNLMIATQYENIIKCGPSKGRKYKCIFETASGTYQVRIDFKKILDENDNFFSASKNFKTEEEAALRYNTILEESLLTIFGPDLGPKVYDLAYKNVIETPVQEQLILR